MVCTSFPPVQFVADLGYELEFDRPDIAKGSRVEFGDPKVPLRPLAFDGLVRIGVPVPNLMMAANEPQLLAVVAMVRNADVEQRRLGVRCNRDVTLIDIMSDTLLELEPKELLVGRLQFLLEN